MLRRFGDASKDFDNKERDTYGRVLIGINACKRIAVATGRVTIGLL